MIWSLGKPPLSKTDEFSENFDHTSHIYIPHTTRNTQPNPLLAMQCFINQGWLSYLIMTMFVWIQIIFFNCFVITLVTLIFNPTILCMCIIQYVCACVCGFRRPFQSCVITLIISISNPNTFVFGRKIFLSATVFELLYDHTVHIDI